MLICPERRRHQQLIRCRSKTGTARYQVEPTDDISVLLEKVVSSLPPGSGLSGHELALTRLWQIYHDAPNADPSTVELSNNPAGGATPVGQLEGSISSLGLKYVQRALISVRGARILMWRLFAP